MFTFDYRHRGLRTKILERARNISEEKKFQGYAICYIRVTGGVPNIMDVTKIINKATVRFIFISKDISNLFGPREQSAAFESTRWRLRSAAKDCEPPSRHKQPSQFAGHDMAVKVRMVEGDDLFQAVWWDDMSVLEKYMGDLNENPA
jgi:hypothetical protein